MKDEILHIQMFGKFSMTYGTLPIVFHRAGSAKSVRLLQMLFLSGARGIAKSELLDCLYGWNERIDMGNRNRNLNNVIYRLRGQLVRAGLPEMDFIQIRDGNCYWNEALPVDLDTAVFEQAFHEAAEADRDRQLALYRRANEIYYGELLPMNQPDMWFYERSIYYKELYEKTVRFLGDEYRRSGNYRELTDLYLRAAAIYPFDNWQTELIRTYLDMDCYDDALRVYNKTMELYARELGTPPTEEMQQCFEKLQSRGREIDYAQQNLYGWQSADLDFSAARTNINRVIREDDQEENAYYCTWPSFVDYCRLMVRSVERTGVICALMFLSLNRGEKKGYSDLEGMKVQMELLREAIKSSVRRGDAFTRYGNRYYVILLAGANRTVCGQIFRRIESAYRRMPGSRGELWYHADALGGGKEKLLTLKYIYASRQKVNKVTVKESVIVIEAVRDIHPISRLDINAAVSIIYDKVNFPLNFFRMSAFCDYPDIHGYPRRSSSL